MMMSTEAINTLNMIESHPSIYQFNIVARIGAMEK